MMMSPTAAKVNGCVIFIASSLDGSCRTCCTAPCAAPCPRSNAGSATRPVMINAMRANRVIFGMVSVFIGNSSSCKRRFLMATITHKIRLTGATARPRCSSTIRWRSGAAYIAQIAGATAIARILKLDDVSIRVGEIKLRGSFSRAASIFHSHAHVRCQRDHGPGGVPPRFHAEIGERFENFVEFEPVHGHAEVGDIRGPRNPAVRTAGAKGHELRPGPNRVDWRWTLIRLNLHTEEVPIELPRALAAGHAECNVIQIAQRKNPPSGRGLGFVRAYLAQVARPGTIARMLKLDHDPVRICEIKFWRPFLCSPRIFPTYSYPRLERAAPRGKICIKGIEFCYAMRGQHLKNPVYLEIVGGHAEVVDAGLCIRPASSQADVLRALPDMKG